MLHYTAMATAEAALARLRDPAAEVSAHWLIAEDGRIWALVPEERRAWHAGAGGWGDVADVNSRSIGIELANPGDAPFAAAQTAALAGLLRRVLDRWAIPPERVIGHEDMAPGRKADPGPRFDWRGLARPGLAVWIDAPPCAADALPADPAALAAAASRFGYPCADPAAVARAVRRRFRPWRDGPPSAGDLAQIAALAARWPVRPG